MRSTRFPAPAASLAGGAVKLWRGEVVAGRGAPGELLAAGGEAGLVVACGTGALRLTELQRPGGRRLAAPDWLRSRPLRAGDRFEAGRPGAARRRLNRQAGPPRPSPGATCCTTSPVPSTGRRCGPAAGFKCGAEPHR